MRVWQQPGGADRRIMPFILLVILAVAIWIIYLVNKFKGKLGFGDRYSRAHSPVRKTWDIYLKELDELEKRDGSDDFWLPKLPFSVPDGGNLKDAISRERKRVTSLIDSAPGVLDQVRAPTVGILTSGISEAKKASSRLLSGVGTTRDGVLSTLDKLGANVSDTIRDVWPFPTRDERTSAVQVARLLVYGVIGIVFVLVVFILYRLFRGRK